ncbi:SRPBCC domain-containing protein [Streptomyces rubiginosohelvolus]|uniref:SRPBCC domain-containing protein n=1 Tax=unclassified Streptomyces TaxID=2593676 RepID=UPI00190DD508|nr:MULTISPECIES: SRPBCC domain-containing protein [unclassified Streptomyces]MBK3534074.1 carbon monoxide dehydrogenase [Streptomyces sp. MBT72]MBK3540925.1 carbon monoxide dehydrogenase [Streptomyces sp. MBT67]MBK3554349.1 carbon monoxide dehydrogenase [Streptomyces sp. MBT61]MBK6032935.1 carbon monoxide dehydrogenase [Streptomyces sp. MBT59]
MEHEVFVPVPVPALLRTLGDPARVARCVPGLQQDADAASPLTGRLKLRAGGHTITYRGELLLTGPERDRFSVTGKGVEARGTGAVELALTIGLTATDGGTTIAYSGTADGDGRLVELEEGAALAAAHRLLDRFTQQLVTESLAAREDGDAGADAHTDADVDDAVAAEGLAGDEEGAVGSGGSGDEIRADGSAGDDPGSVYDSPVPPPSLDPVAGVEFTVPDEPPAEAAHARRTMIGRSAEEVDHAPPRGRYAPVPSPEAGGASTTLRWVAPAAALALASAVVLGRALRRRRP